MVGPENRAVEFELLQYVSKFFYGLVFGELAECAGLLFSVKCGAGNGNYTEGGEKFRLHAVQCVGGILRVDGRTGLATEADENHDGHFESGGLCALSG